MIDKKNQDNIIFRLFKNTEKDDLNYIYRGIFSEQITDSILALGETTLEKISTATKIKRRVYLVMVEGLQNVTKHKNPHSQQLQNKDFFIIQHKSDNYYISTANLIDNSNVGTLKAQIDKINQLSPDELKDLYKEILRFGQLSERGGAGLGLVDMARKSGNTLNYHFEKIDDRFSYFYLQVAINPEEAGTIHNQILTLAEVAELHKKLSDENISLVFNSLLNQENILYLLSIIETQLADSNINRRKVYNTIVEMLQNITHHGKNMNEDSEYVPAVFFIGEDDEKFLINAGNYVLNKDITDLCESLDYVNSLDFDELEVYYNKKLFNFEVENVNNAGVGIIDIRLKSRATIDYEFEKIDDKFSFFSISVPIMRQ